MYRQLQEKVKEHIIGTLCQISDKWKFDIDDEKKDEPIIVGYGPDGLIIRTAIEKFHWVIPKELNDSVAKLCEIPIYHATNMGGCMLVRKIIDSVFSLYGLQTYHANPSYPCFDVINKNGAKRIGSNIWGVIGNGVKIRQETNISHFISPFWSKSFWDYVMKEQLISPILLLLDPISYFRRYEIIMQKYPQLERNHTWGMYELLLEYFPEMNDELFQKYCAIWFVFKDMCTDMITVIGRILIELYVEK